MTPEIYPAFRDLIPPLAVDELQALEADIVAHGCRDPLVVWNGKLIDGHNRLGICTRLGVPFSTVDYTSSSLLPDEGSVMRWICDNQLARRNLTPFQACYLRGKRYLLLRVTRTQHGQNGRLGDDGWRLAPAEVSGEKRALVAAEHGVGARTISRDVKYAEYVDAIAESAGLDVRNAILRAEVRITRRAIGEVAALRPASLEQVREFLTSCRTTRPSERAQDDVRPHFQRTIKEWVKDAAGMITAAKLSVCGHVVPCKARKGDVSGRKTMACPRCGSGSRPAWERRRHRLALERSIREAVANQRGFIALVDLVDAAISVLTIPPQTEQQQELWGRIDHGIEVARLVVSPGEAVR